MRTHDYVDERGRKFRVELPEGVLDEDAQLGVPIGPPDVVDVLELPEPVATRLHNQLFDRQLWGMKELRRNTPALEAALKKALRIDVQLLHQAYTEYEKEPVSNGR